MSNVKIRGCQTTTTQTDTTTQWQQTTTLTTTTHCGLRQQPLVLPHPSVMSNVKLQGCQTTTINTTTQWQQLQPQLQHSPLLHIVDYDSNLWTYHICLLRPTWNYKAVRQQQPILLHSDNNNNYDAQHSHHYYTLWIMAATFGLTTSLCYVQRETMRLSDNNNQYYYTVTTTTARQHWIQRITFTAETNAACSYGSADTHTDTQPLSDTTPSPLTSGGEDNKQHSHHYYTLWVTTTSFALTTSACHQTFELLRHWLLLKTYSRLIYSFSHIMQLKFEYHVLYGALVVTLWTCYGALL